MQDVGDLDVENVEGLKAGFVCFFFGGASSCFFQTLYVGFVQDDDPRIKISWVAEDEFAELAEPPIKTRRITKDMPQEEVAKIQQERLDRKRAFSRAWHAKYESKGVTCQISFCLKQIVTKKSPFLYLSCKCWF